MTHSTTSKQQNAAMVNENRKSFLRWFGILMLLLILPTSVTMAQNRTQNNDKNDKDVFVRFVEVKATKTYPEGNQITYVKATGLPTDKDLADKLEQYIISMMRVTRMKVYFNQDLFLLDGDEDIKPEWVVDEMNVFLRRYYAEMNQEKE